MAVIDVVSSGQLFGGSAPKMRIRASLYTPTVTVTLLNVVVGSRYYVTVADTGAVLGSGVASSSKVEISGVEYFHDIPIIVKVRLSSSIPKYAHFETPSMLTSKGASIWVSQVEDKVAELS